MSYLRHIATCNSADAVSSVPLRYNNADIGLLTLRNRDALRDFPSLFEVEEAAVTLRTLAGGREDVTRELEAASRELVRRSFIRQMRHEAFAVSESWGSPILFDLDRGAVPFFGTKGYGVHLNGYRRRGNSYDLWIGRRSPTKQVAPDKLDNMVAGGIASGHGARATLVKEAGEEASMPPELAAQACAVGALAYRMAQEGGIRNDILFIFDLEVPEAFTPAVNDGEIVRFHFMSLEECLQRIRDTDDFKFNVNLVIADFAVRHGVIGPDDPEYLALIAGLRKGLG